MTKILTRLRSETREEHAAIEGELGLADDGLTLAAYRHVLEQFWGFYAPLEARLAPWGSHPAWEVGVSTRRKRHWLEADLRMLGIPDSDALPVCDRLPELPHLAAAMGCTYVLEGATLGGQLITRHVTARLGITEDRGCRFFSGYGDRTGTMWSEFSATLRHFAECHGQEDEIVSSAIRTFRALRLWCAADHELR